MGVYLAYARIIKAAKLVAAIGFAKRHGIGSTSPPVYLDIGARGGLPPAWSIAARFGIIRPVFVEADAAEARRLSSRYHSATVVPYALGSKQEVRNLYLTADRALSSLLVPDVSAYTEFDVAPFTIERIDNVEVFRLDNIWSQYESGEPCYVKIDIQGFEREVLEGMGELLDSIVCLEFESTFLPVYAGQPRFQDLYDFLHGRGFDLVRINAHGLGYGGITEFNAFMVSRHHQDDHRVRFWKLMNDVGSHRRVVTFGY